MRRARLLTASLVLCVCAFATPVAPAAAQTTVYSNDFSSSVGGEWSPSTTISTSPSGEKFLGDPFDNATESLTLTGLSAHTDVTISFDLYVLETWDGNGPDGPDLWGATVSGGPVLQPPTTFGVIHEQSYPDPYPSIHPPTTGASAVNSLGFPCCDSTYHFSYTIPHAASSITFDFTGSGLQGWSDEGWGLDNVAVSVAESLQCGDTITTDTTLTRNLVCPDDFTGTALTIAANNVRLDLAGHTIQNGPNNAGAVGIFASAAGGVPGTRILNGSIQGFDYGVQLISAVNSHIRRLTISAGLQGILVVGGGGAGLDNCQSNVTNCIVHNVIEITNASTAIGTSGIEVVSDYAQIYGNTVRGTPLQAIVVRGDKPRVNLNRIEGCQGLGISVSEYSTYAIVWNNTVLGCTASGSEGIEVFAATNSGGNARVRRNTVTGTDFGIDVRDTNAFIAQNDSSGNRVDGIDVGFENVGNVVQQNNADNNGQYGINAAPGTIDGGGNTASGNGAQDCVNVTCSP
jgi:Right handed beta helix region